MSESPSVQQSVWPPVVLGFVLVAWFAPPDPMTQLRWAAPGLVVAVLLGSWFAHDGYRVLDATVSDCWTFVVTFLGGLVLGGLLVPNPVLSTLQQALLVTASALVAVAVVYYGVFDRVHGLFA
ncbi:DUF7534 family protein [Haloarchaeobius sp. HRN-SO-5]|uniref:DUF7534 family protein n=1 Tax=Haloarchaeobius sp. HRN-SO-5 TaxID=3446118 RepID=UPI003EBD41DA